MRIALICPYSCTVPGGVQTQVLGLARALRSRGDEVAVIAPAETARMAGRLDEAALDGAIFIKVGAGTPVSVNGSRAPVSPWPATMSRTLAALRSSAPQVVHVHEPFVPGPTLGAVLTGPRPIVATFHRSGADLAYRVYGHLVGPFSRRLDEVFAVSEEAASTARACVGRLPRRIRIIPNGVEVQRFASTDPWPSSGPTVVFIGRHERRKGLEVLLEAFALLPASTRLWVLGDGPETGRLRARFGSDARIEWPGRVDDDERARRLAGAHVLVAPSLDGESFGMVLLEAMAAGTAVVASDLPGYRLAAAGAARLVPTGDRTALAEAVAELLGDDAEREALCQRGRLRAWECDMGAVADLYRDVYARLGRPGRG
ncbi:MAG: glycosyltransferase family 4 protein [Acidimicrobiales bacterium]|jgi:phosphatidylinositol alpha-mannosyltransferase